MGRYFDFEPPKPWGGGFSHLGDALGGVADAVAARQTRQQKAMHEQGLLDTEKAKQAIEQEKAKLYAGQVAAQKQSQDRADLQQNITFEQGQQDRRRNIGKDIYKAIGQGAYGEAQSAADSSQFTDPRTGQQQGFSLRQSPLPPEPVAPVAPEPTDNVQGGWGPGRVPDYVQVMTPEQARTDAIRKAQGARRPDDHRGQVFVDQQEAGSAHLLGGAEGEDVFNYPVAQIPGGAKEGQWIPDPRHPGQLTPEEEAAAAEAEGLASGVQTNRAQFSELNRKFEGDRGVYEGQRAAYDKAKDNPSFILGTPSGGQVTLDRNEARATSARDAEDTAAKLRAAAANPALPPDVARAMLLTAGLAPVQLSNADKAPITNMNAAVEAQGFKGGQNDKDREVKREAIHAKQVAKGAGHSAGGMGQLIKIAQDAYGPNGELLNPEYESQIADLADQLHIQTGGKDGWLGPVKEVIRGRKVGYGMSERDQGLQATDAQGNQVGKYKSATDAKTGTAQDIQFERVKDRLASLIQDVQDNGARVETPDAIQRRLNRATEVQAALRKYNDLGSTDFSQRLEGEIQGAVGTPGNGYLMGANVDTYRHMLEGATKSHEAARGVRLRAGSQPKPPGGGAPAQGGGVQSLQMPDGSIAHFDANGKRLP